MSNPAIDQILLDAIIRQGGPKLQADQVVFTRLPDSGIPGQPRRFKVQINPPLNEVIKDFTVVMQPNHLHRQLTGGTVIAFPRQWTAADIKAALLNHLQVDLRDDEFDVTTSDGGHEVITRLVANDRTMLYEGELVLVAPKNPYKMIEATNGGLNQLTTAAELAEINHAQRLGRICAALPSKWPGRVDRVLFSSRRESLAAPIAPLVTLGGVDNHPLVEFPIEVDDTMVDLNTLHLAGGYQLTLTEPTDFVHARLFNIDANGDRLLSWEGAFADLRGWDAIPVTAKSSVLTLSHSGDPSKTAIGFSGTFNPYRQVFVSQPIEEYAPVLEDVTRMRFSGFQRLESDLMELGSAGHFIGARINIASLPTKGTSRIISIEGQDDAWLSLIYDAGAGKFIGALDGLADVVSIKPTDFAGEHITVALSIDSSTLNLWVQGNGGVTYQHSQTPVSTLGPSSGRIRVGGETEEPFSLREFFHFKGRVTPAAATWFVENLNVD
ncbi:hypothetical protein [Stenotrophomonas sp. GD03657]|uniref:hypothetical protein n=1 Tax=Stenotrophomonas sp. GD03657 TaxID=2975363 RepID=UPI0024493910|nr:hypothetical protein [Stenotrophomonas sp. GD03657]MDH2154200.1 hypothetical protein [Stenotrophomonas sp. GD03657]